MSTPSLQQRRERSLAELVARCPLLDAAEVLSQLTTGLDQLRDLLTLRVHEDVQAQSVVDSMWAPLSLSDETARLRRADEEIKRYLSLVVEDEVVRGGYVDAPDAWFLDWLLALQFGEGYPSIRDGGVSLYRSVSERQRRLRFVAALERAMPASSRTPRVLFSLLPLAVRIVASTAFADGARAQTLRAEQRELLPAIGDCPQCRGCLLKVGEKCGECSNPLWTFAWLRET